ncbi:hypothetical protein MTO96_009158 [Rhipicephalus appendiculatus]
MPRSAFDATIVTTVPAPTTGLLISNHRLLQYVYPVTWRLGVERTYFHKIINPRGKMTPLYKNLWNNFHVRRLPVNLDVLKIPCPGWKGAQFNTQTPLKIELRQIVVPIKVLHDWLVENLPPFSEYVQPVLQGKDLPERLYKSQKSLYFLMKRAK